MRINFIIFILILIALELGVSFYMRINYWPFYQHFGFYQGDIWYFFSYYGDQIKNLFFFPMEYPVGYLLVQKIAYFISRYILGQFSYPNFMFAHALLVIPAAISLIWLTVKIAEIININVKKTYFYLLVSPSFFIYSTINYDIFPVTLTTLATWLALKNKFYPAFFCLALGVTIKIYPLFLLPVFILFMLFKNYRHRLLISLIIFIGTLLITNLPFALTNINYFIFPYYYQFNNPEKNDPTTLSYYLVHATGLSNGQFLLMIVLLTTAWLISYVFFKKRILSDKNFILLLLLTTLAIILGHQVYVPQYLLWFWPFLTLVQFPSIAIFLPFDLLNASTRFFYFKLKGEWSFLLHSFWLITVIYYLILYILLLKYVKKLLFKKR